MKKVKGVFELFFDKPVDAEVTPVAGKYGADRSYGSHRGVDYGAERDSKVMASEGGKVVFAQMLEGTEERPSYGKVVVIDHTPGAGEGELHIYTLYAHLDLIIASVPKDERERVKKGDIVGKSGNTGTKEYHIGKKRNTSKDAQRGYHLHFEVIESRVGWNKGVRVDPSGYIGVPKTLKYYWTDQEIRKIRECLFIDFVRDSMNKSWRLDAYLNGKKVGSLDKHTNELKFKITPEELEELMKSSCPPLPPARESVEPKRYEITIGGSR
jgi:murein DD-endopeptidase MepM/ murein hydrolase activator NlpD